MYHCVCVCVCVLQLLSPQLVFDVFVFHVFTASAKFVATHKDQH